MTVKMFRALAMAALALGSPAFGQGMTPGMAPGQGHAMQLQHGKTKGHMMHRHGPIGVMGRHILPKGRFVLAYRMGHMEMSGSRIGSTDVSPTFIATTVPNRFFGRPGQPPTLRVVPTKMQMTMHMLGVMYGATDRLTIGAMVPYVEKSMTALTYAGAAGPAVLGSSKMTTRGPGDIKLAAHYAAYRKDRRSLNVGMGLSLPTGSITETGVMLAPSGALMLRRAAYGMQLGSGTFDLMPSITYQSAHGKWHWGTQLHGTIRLGTNSEGYTLGNEVALTAWAGVQATKWLALSGRIEAKTMGRISGIDPLIVGPMQGADPRNYGGETVMAYLAADTVLRKGALKGHRIGIELGIPLAQKLNGVQLKRDWGVVFAWRKPF